MLQINVGDIGARIVRALGIRGRVPVSLDEMVIPTVLLQDQTDSLYAQNPAEVACLFQLVGANVNAGAYVIQNLKPDVVVKVDRVVFQDGSSVAPTVNLSIGLARAQLNLLQATDLGSSSAVLNQDASNVVRSQCRVSTGNPAAVPGVGRVDFLQVKPIIGQLFEVKLGVVLYQDDAIIFSLPPGALTSYIEGGAVFQREFSMG